MRRGYVIGALLMATAGLVISAVAQEQSVSIHASNTSVASDLPSKPAKEASATKNSASSNTASGAAPGATEASLRLEGEKRFRTNCGRCHQPPHKFAPRVMATAIRHMRVRAMITDEDMRLILRYMTE